MSSKVTYTTTDNQFADSPEVTQQKILQKTLGVTLSGSATEYLNGTGAWSTPTVSAVGIVPIGGIVAWHKTFANTPALPAQFLECNGQVVNDVGSPFNTQTLPDLNSTNTFLRGNTTSGATGGAATHSHGTGATSNDDLDNTGGANYLVSLTSPTQTASSLPPFMMVVWVMRIK